MCGFENKAGLRFPDHPEIIHRIAGSKVKILGKSYCKALLEIKVDRLDVAAIDLERDLLIAFAVRQYSLKRQRTYAPPVLIRIDVELMQEKMVRAFLTDSVVAYRVAIGIDEGIVL